MKTVFINAKEDMVVVESAMPTPQSDEVRIKVAYVGICGSDLHYYFNGANGAFIVKEPLTPGHELSGIIDLDPSGEFSVGDKITVHPAHFGNHEEGLESAPQLWAGGNYLGSASTWPHTQGAMAQYMIVKKFMIRKLPADLKLKAAALAEPTAVALHAINMSSGVTGKKILVTGSGPIGLLLIAVAKIKGAAHITSTDLLEGPLERAKLMGADETINVAHESIPENSYDIVFECSGVAPAISSAIVSAKKRGEIIQVGMLGAGAQQIAIAPLISKEITLRGTFRFIDEIDEAITLITSHRVFENALTHTFDLSDISEAFTVAKNSQISGKVLVQLGEFDE